ncbi:hypothetical protein [Accumulibacter sp.]|uniref:hypothetical protein n=1 Tax=Accumulibacter sp. TaxID=2053492 RepID=UPI0026351D75|nr:hypothetical protein [Accumulibacter sp.]
MKIPTNRLTAAGYAHGKKGTARHSAERKRNVSITLEQPIVPQPRHLDFPARVLVGDATVAGRRPLPAQRCQ